MNRLIDFNAIQRRAVSSLQERLIPIVQYKIRKQLEKTRSELLLKHGRGSKDQIDEFLAVCKERLNSKLGAIPLADFIRLEVEKSSRFVASRIEEPEQISSGQRTAELSDESELSPIVQELINRSNKLLKR